MFHALKAAVLGLAATAGIAAAGGAEAATLYTDRAAFDAVGAGNAYMANLDNGTSLNFGPVSITGNAVHFDSASPGTAGLNGNPNGTGWIQFRLGSAATMTTVGLSLIGFDIRPYFNGGSNDGGETVSYTTNIGDNGIFTLSPNHVTTFLGLGFSGPVTTITFARAAPSSADDGSTWFGIDNVQAYTGSLASPAAVPEPASWAMMIGGFGLVGAALRRRAGAGRLAAA